MNKRTTKSITINFRVAPAERQLLERAARQAHLHVGTWMRQTCLRAAEQVVGGDERRARLLDFIQRAREGKNPPATTHAAEVERAPASRTADFPCVSYLFDIELEREEDGRWIAEIPSLPGALAYGATSDAARAAVEALALRVLADRIEHGEMPVSEPLSVAFA